MKMIDKIFRDKKSNTLIYIILAVGIVMLVCAKSPEESRNVKEKTFSVTTTDAEMQLEQILSDIEGVGAVSVMISSVSTEKDKEEVKSVLVVSEGGSNSEIREKIIRAVKVALGVDSHKIEVFERKEDQ